MFLTKRTLRGCLLFCFLNTGTHVLMAMESGHIERRANSAAKRELRSHGEPLQLAAYLSSASWDSQAGESCIAWLRLKFDRPVNLATLAGKVTLSSYGHHLRPFFVIKNDRSFTEFILQAPDKNNCRQGDDAMSIELAGAIFAVDGQKLSRSVSIPLSFDSRGLLATGRTLLPLPANLRWVTNPALSRKSSWPVAYAGVSAVDLNRAYAVVQSWANAEKLRPLYRTSGLVKLPMKDLILKPFNSASIEKQYGAADTLYVIRRAAKFVSALFPELTEIRVADLSDKHGNTPSAILGEQKILLHPAGSHVAGRDADITYLSSTPGDATAGIYDMRMSFWYLYSILQSTGVDLVMTAYKTDFVAMARQLYQRGLISEVAAGRFNMLMEDHELNHDKHMHIDVGNANNGQVSRKFTLYDDVYSCYLAMKPGLAGGIFNYCAD